MGRIQRPLIPMILPIALAWNALLPCISILERHFAWIVFGFTLGKTPIIKRFFCALSVYPRMEVLIRSERLKRATCSKGVLNPSLTTTLPIQTKNRCWRGDLKAVMCVLYAYKFAIISLGKLQNFRCLAMERVLLVSIPQFLSSRPEDQDPCGDVCGMKGEILRICPLRSKRERGQTHLHSFTIVIRELAAIENR